MAPASLTRCTTKSLAPAMPTAGWNSTTLLMFSPPKPLGSTSSCHLIPGHNIYVDYCRCVIPEVHPGDGIQGGGSQIPLVVALPDATINGRAQIAAGDVYVLSQFHEYHRHTSILAKGDALLASDVSIFQYLAQDIPAQFRRLFSPGGSESHPPRPSPNSVVAIMHRSRTVSLIRAASISLICISYSSSFFLCVPLTHHHHR